MTFEEWFYEQFDRPREAAEEAWNYQQERIDELEAQLREFKDNDDLTAAYMAGYHDAKYKCTEGYVLVPVEPTEKMIESGLMFHSQFCSSVPNVYKAMIQEAQEQE